MAEDRTVQTSLPDDTQAFEFAVMMNSGLPAVQAILYFVELTDPQECAAWAQRWQGCRAVNAAAAKLMGGRWQDKTTQEKMDYALEQHYNQLSTTLITYNYLEASAQEKAKMDDARKAIEAKQAGTAGQMVGIESFYADLKAGRVKINRPSVNSPTPLKAH